MDVRVDLRDSLRLEIFLEFLRRDVETIYHFKEVLFVFNWHRAFQKLRCAGKSDHLELKLIIFQQPNSSFDRKDLAFQ